MNVKQFFKDVAQYTKGGLDGFFRAGPYAVLSQVSKNPARAQDAWDKLMVCMERSFGRPLTEAEKAEVRSELQRLIGK